MFKSILTAIICIGLLQINAFSKDKGVDEIIFNVLKARGTKESLKEINSMKIEGKISAMGMEFPLSVQYKAPDKSRTEFDMMGSKMINVINGKEGWFINPMMGNSDPTKMPDDVYQETKTQYDFVNYPLSNYKENGIKITLQGTETVGGKECYKLFMVTKDAKESYLYVDILDYLPYCLKSKGNVMGKDADMETYFKDYKKIKNVNMPHTIENSSGGQLVATIKFDKVDVDIDIPDAIFEMPKK